MRKIIPPCIHRISTTDTTMTRQPADIYEAGYYFCCVCGSVFKQDKGETNMKTTLRRQQLTEALTLLMGPNGIRYADFIGLQRSIAIKRCKNLLAKLDK